MNSILFADNPMLMFQRNVFYSKEEEMHVRNAFDILILVKIGHVKNDN